MDQALRQPDVADLFERVLVPALFEPYARDLVERARPFGPSDRILDLGCGTGIVARVLRERLGGAASITGVDISAAMLAKARALAPAVDWREGNATALPLPDRSFEVVLAQQVLQFVPDREAAARELRRVLAAGGRVVASTWRPRSYQALHEALGGVAERHLGPSRDLRFSLDGEPLRALFVAAGFVDVELTTVALTEHHREFSPQLIRLSLAAAGFDLAAQPAERIAAVIADSAGAIAALAADGGYAAPSITNVVTARVP